MKRKESKPQNAMPEQSNPGIGRRDFFKLLGGGITIFFFAGEIAELFAIPPQRRPLPTDFNAFLHIAENGEVSCFTGKIEMGQGVVTSLAQMLADELDADPERVRMVMGDTDLCPWDMGTFGSMTTRFFGPPLRAAAAEARAVLLELASEFLRLPSAELAVEKGIVYHTKKHSKQVGYGALTKGRRIERFMEIKPPVKDHSAFRVMNRPYLRKDSLEKVTGKALFSGDMKKPGMLYARILRPPSHGAKLISADVSEAERMAGIQVVREGDLIAVLHELPDRSREAIAKLRAEWEFNEMEVNDETIFDHLLKNPLPPVVTAENGDLETGQRMAELIVESEFRQSYVAHAPIEMHTAMAYPEADRIIVHASTQTPFPTQENIARELGLHPEKIRLIPPYVGGGFGGKSASQQAIEAARLAKATGKPVMVNWTRQEEFFYDTFLPAAVVKVRAGADLKGKIVLWDYSQYFAGSRGSDTIYDVPHFRTTSYGQGWTAPGVHPFATGPWRAPGNNTNTFGRESQIDILAFRAGIDPLEFRLMNLEDERMIAVLKELAGLFGYSPAKTPSGRGIGIACGTDAGTYVAHIAEVKVDRRTGQIKVERVACAQDMGLCINPQGAATQMEGCIAMGLGYALSEEIKFSGGRIHTRNFATYGLPTFSSMPLIETRILHRPDQPSRGGGEPAIICMGAVLANAVFDATGARLFRLPMTPERVKEALASI